VAYLLDTNVLSEITRRSPDPNVKRWLDSVHGPLLYVSVMVVGEIRQGVERLRRRDPVRAAVYETWLARMRHEFSDRIVPITPDIAEEWGLLGVPDPLPLVDGLLAATAKVHGWTLVTRNVRDVERTGVRVLNPFEP
jgi:predicted nucleic acid-binding protein